jgi:dimethylargininase
VSVVALTRNVAPTITDCELTHLEREPIDFARASGQHDRYEQSLVAAGCVIQRLPDLPDMPDSVFVEDTAVVLSEIAVITRPGAESRRRETPSVADALRPHRTLAHIESPGTLDGGDVLVIGSTIYVGESFRTNSEGIRQLAAISSAHAYTLRPVRLSGCLHLKSAVTRVGDDVVLINPAWVDETAFASLHRIEVDPAEPFAANALRIGRNIICSTGYNETRRRLEQNGICVELVDMDELRKAEGGVTCCSILIDL